MLKKIMVRVTQRQQAHALNTSTRTQHKYTHSTQAHAHTNAQKSGAHLAVGQHGAIGQLDVASGVRLHSAERPGAVEPGRWLV